jgi:hypothetical protein
MGAIGRADHIGRGTSRVVLKSKIDLSKEEE